MIASDAMPRYLDIAFTRGSADSGGLVAIKSADAVRNNSITAGHGGNHASKTSARTTEARRDRSEPTRVQNPPP
jgi:hypothetical protein